MGLYAGFDVIDDFGFLDATEEYGIIPDYSEGCDVFCEVFEAVAKDLVPVDTGFLQSSISADTDGTTCECEATAEYAQYVEFGTWKMEAQPYFEPALEMALASAEPLWVEAQMEALLEEEMLMEEEEEERQAMQQQQMMMQQSMMQQSMMASSGGGSILGSIGAIVMTLAVVAVFTIVQEMFKDIFGGGSRGGSSSSSRHGSGEGGMVFMPEIEIT